MTIKQFEDRHLAHFSYAILNESDHQMILIDPARNPEPYYAFASRHKADIIAVIETHPHADFVSSHLEISRKTGAPVYTSKQATAGYPHTGFDEGSILSLGNIKLKSLNTPGHSPDSISIVLEEDGKIKAVFTGDTLFIGDCGRPDLREKAGSQTASRQSLARSMYHSLREKLIPLPDDTWVYPAHGAGSLCGKSLKDQKVSTIGEEKQANWSLQEMTEEDFIAQLLTDQPFIPSYFGYDVQLNLSGAPDFEESVQQVPTIRQASVISPSIINASVISPSVINASFINEPPTNEPPANEPVIIDTRDESAFKNDHLPHSINLMTGDPFETWLGTLVAPQAPFYLAAADENTLRTMIGRTASIGYEKFIAGAFVFEESTLSEESALSKTSTPFEKPGLSRESGFLPESPEKTRTPEKADRNTFEKPHAKHSSQIPSFDLDEFRSHPDRYTIVDVRNESETKDHRLFANSINLPLPLLKDRWNEIPLNKPIVVHCAGGYRSAAASSMLLEKLKGKAAIFDLGNAVKDFMGN